MDAGSKRKNHGDTLIRDHLPAEVGFKDSPIRVKSLISHSKGFSSLCTANFVIAKNESGCPPSAPRQVWKISTAPSIIRETKKPDQIENLSMNKILYVITYEIFYEFSEIIGGLLFRVTSTKRLDRLLGDSLHYNYYRCIQDSGSPPKGLKILNTLRVRLYAVPGGIHPV
jgi:hypothetical protein